MGLFRFFGGPLAGRMESYTEDFSRQPAAIVCRDYALREVRRGFTGNEYIYDYLPGLGIPPSELSNESFEKLVEAIGSPLAE